MVLSILLSSGMTFATVLLSQAPSLRRLDTSVHPVACSLTGDRDRVIVDCTTLITAGDTSRAKRAAAYFARGNAYAAKSEPDRALSDFNAAIAIEPHDARFFNNRALMYEAKGDLDHAIADFDEALRLEPNNVAVLVNRGRAHADLKEDAQAQADYDRVLSAAPDFAFAYLARAALRFRSGDIAGAEADIARFRRLRPSDPEGAKAEAAVRASRNMSPR